MEPFITLLILVLLVTAAGVITRVAIYNRKRPPLMRPEGLNETQQAVIAEKHAAPQEPQAPVMEEAEPTTGEETLLTAVAETQPTGIHEAHLPAMAETQPTVIEEAQSTKVQQAQPIAEEASWATVQETQETVPAETLKPTIIVETQTPRAGETQAIAIEETQPIAAEETGPTGTKQSEQPETLKVQPEGTEEAVAEAKNGKREPIKRGGKPRGPTQSHEEERTQQIKPRRPKPAIVCWKRERQWVLAVEVPNELIENSDLEVLQNGSPLQPDDLERAFWRLDHVSGEVIVRWNEAEALQEVKVELRRVDHLLFRLSGGNLNRGCRVKFPSSGAYLVIAPEDWERDETLSGPPPATPESVSLVGYKAHFFNLGESGNVKIALRLPDGQPLVIEAKAPQFELVGKQLTDASEHMGPLFGDAPPRILAVDAKKWENVRSIVVGEEGPGLGRWRTTFSPDPGQREQELPPEVAAKKSGWYFLRFYDANDDLIESLDYRFIADLRGIELPVPQPLPSVDRHKPVSVALLHAKGCVVQPAGDSTNIQMVLKDDRTTLIVPPDPACDLSRWLVSPKNGSPVEVTILVERMWWALAEENTRPSQWTDKPVLLSLEDFRATSSKALWLRLPRSRWVDKVRVGFEWSKARPYNVKVTEKTLAVLLRDFGDSQEVGNEGQEYSFRVWIERDRRLDEGILALVPASRPQSWVGLGRYKTAIGRAVIQNGSGNIKVNGQPIHDYFRQAPRKARQFLKRLLEMEEVRETLSRLEVNITFKGSRPTTMRQPKAVAHAIARAIMNYDPRLARLLRQAGFGGVKVKDSEVGKRSKQ
jgi:small subunit ribosomal protein S9